ncbi:hypothetical protein [Natribacillus halophilus]|uniref:hypothetical protein n=1 Tax=Natribacillus halophilus TaxID=549003 RepID=UPI000B8288D0|nr:hypothetical protein [Natribacillus halophilus]
MDTILVVLFVLLLCFILLMALNIAAHAYIIKSGASYGKILAHTLVIMGIALVIGFVFWSLVW